MRIRNRLQQQSLSSSSTDVVPQAMVQKRPDPGITFHKRHACDHNHDSGVGPYGNTYARGNLPSPAEGNIGTDSDHSTSLSSSPNTHASGTPVRTVPYVSTAPLKKNNTQAVKNCIHSQHLHHLDGRCGHQVCKENDITWYSTDEPSDRFILLINVHSSATSITHVPLSPLLL